MGLKYYEAIARSLEWEGYIDVDMREESYYCQVNISNTSKELLNLFRNNVKFGHIIGPYKRDNKNHKDKYIWVMSLKEIKEYLLKIEPFLLVKNEQAQLVIKALSIIKDKEYVKTLSSQDKKEMYTFEEFCELDWCYRRCKELNRRGK